MLLPFGKEIQQPEDYTELTSKLIWPPMENVKFRCANFSRSTETIFGRMLCT
jgi:hypothetical protein